MSAITRPLATTTSLSILLHGAVLIVLLVVYQQVSSTGKGLEIELIASTMVSNHQETDMLRKPELEQAQQDVVLENVIDSVQKESVKKQSRQQNIVTIPTSQSAVSISDTVDQYKVMQNEQHRPQVPGETASNAQIVKSTNASPQQQTILELLHARIGENKEYPYMARRQRREGIATVAFVLHPDGSIENTRLVVSSRAGALDRAALSAVQHIEPFKAAQNYLDRAEEFKIDVVFKLL